MIPPAKVRLSTSLDTVDKQTVDSTFLAHEQASKQRMVRTSRVAMCILIRHDIAGAKATCGRESLRRNLGVGTPGKAVDKPIP